MSLTIDPNDPDLGHGSDKEEVGQNKKYLVLSPEELAKGFVRPVRTKYIHEGKVGPKYHLRDLTEDEKKIYDKCFYVKYEVYPESESPCLGRFWTQARLDNVGRGGAALRRL